MTYAHNEVGEHIIGCRAGIRNLGRSSCNYGKMWQRKRAVDEKRDIVQYLCVLQVTKRVYLMHGTPLKLHMGTTAQERRQN
jgi:hypothetical protein